MIFIESLLFISIFSNEEKWEIVDYKIVRDLFFMCNVSGKKWFIGFVLYE